MHGADVAAVNEVSGLVPLEQFDGRAGGIESAVGVAENAKEHGGIVGEITVGRQCRKWRMAGEKATAGSMMLAGSRF